MKKPFKYRFPFTVIFPFRLQNHHAYPAIFALLAVISLGIAFSPMGPEGKLVEKLLSLLGTAAAFVYFLYFQHKDQTRLFIDLSDRFNVAYGGMNEKLAEIHSYLAGKENVDLKSDVEKDRRDQLIDYFNLCAEEYLYHKANYIDQDVWKAWQEGMAFHYRQKSIKELWKSQIKESDSFYGFSLEEIDIVAEKQSQREATALRP